MKEKMKRFIKVNLIILVIFSLIAIKSFAEESEEDFENINSEEKARTEELEKEKKQIEQQTEQYSSQLGFINEELSSTIIEVAELNQTIYDKQTEIEELTFKEEQLSKLIKQVDVKLQESIEEYEKQKKLLEKRLVAMYEIGDTSYLDLLLNSKGISEFLSNYYYISEIANTDSELLSIVKEQKENIEKLVTTLEEKEKELDEAKANLEKASIAISNMIIIKNQRIEQLTENELLIQQQIDEYQSQLQEIESEIRLLSLASNNDEYVGGIMLWPVPGYTRVSSQFGMRTHPITGVYKLHTGTDIGAPFGTQFVAANDGLVVKAGYNGAYGNMVIIDHGGGISTLYAHGSEILVKEGDLVKQGTNVLKVGSTGYSTGPHAHFEIRINGEYVNPLDYLPNNNTENNNQSETIELDKDN